MLSIVFVIKMCSMKKFARTAGIILIMLVGMAATYKTESNKEFEILKNIEIFVNLYQEINHYYVDDLDPGKLMRTGIDAMMASLDPFTNYISETDIEGYRFFSEGRYHGIGAASELIDGFNTITELYQDQPADKAGLKVGDKIVAVEGQDAKNRTPDELQEILRGYPGTEVDLTIRRPGKSGDFKIKLVRGEVEVQNVPYSGMIDNEIGYITLTTFTQNAGKNVADALRKLKQENPGLKGLIFDLRGNGGGLLSEAVNVSNVFIPKNELVVTTKGKIKERDSAFKTLNEAIDLNIPMVVLINKGSASASEIVSGVMQDYDRAVLMGQRSYGKGLVQNTRDLKYNAKVKMTIAKYYIPSQRCIQSVEYKNGEPVDISDDRRTAFKTRNGRTVLDGGGLAPDVLVEKPTERGILKSLIDENLVFDFVTRFCQANESIPSVENFHFTDFDGFLAFLNEKNYEYESDSEKALKTLEADASEEGLNLKSDIQQLRNKITSAKQDELTKYKSEIIDLIEKEISGRYYYQRGKVQMGLRNDLEIKEAAELLKDQARYKKILAIQ